MKTFKVLCRGKGITDFYVEGYAHFVENPVDDIGKCNGKILITNAPSPDIVILMRECTGIISRTGGLTCHVALVGREMGTPAIVGARELFDSVTEGMYIGLESTNEEGVVYEIGSV